MSIKMVRAWLSVSLRPVHKRMLPHMEPTVITARRMVIISFIVLLVNALLSASANVKTRNEVIDCISHKSSLHI